MIILGGKSTFDSFPLNYALKIPDIPLPPLVAAMGSSAEMPPAHDQPVVFVATRWSREYPT